MNAVHRTNWQTKLTTCACLFNHRVHALVRADNRVHWASLQAQGASNAPGFINPNDLSRTLNAIFWVQRLVGFASDAGKSMNALIAPGRTLVDLGLTLFNGLRVLGAVRETAAGALRLGQCGQNAIGLCHRSEVTARCWVALLEPKPALDLEDLILAPEVDF